MIFQRTPAPNAGHPARGAALAAILALALLCPRDARAAPLRRPPGAIAVPADTAPRGGHRVSYGLLVAHDQVREDLLAPLRWAGAGPGIRASWELRRARGEHRLAAAIPFTFLENRFGHPGYGLSPEAGYSYVHDVAATPGGGTLAAGLEGRWRMYGGYYSSWDEEHLYWLTSIALGPRMAWRQGAPGEQGFSAELSLPAAAVVSRPPRSRSNKIDDLTRPSFYLAGTMRGARGVGFPGYRAVHAGVAYTRGSGRRRLVVGYELDASYYGSPAAVVQTSNRMSVSQRIAF